MKLRHRVADRSDLALTVMLEIAGICKFLEINLQVLNDFTLVDSELGGISKPTNDRCNYESNRCRYVIDLADDLDILDGNLEVLIDLSKCCGDQIGIIGVLATSGQELCPGCVGISSGLNM